MTVKWRSSVSAVVVKWHSNVSQVADEWPWPLSGIRLAVEWLNMYREGAEISVAPHWP